MDQTLLLVDGSSYLYRAFHALPDLRNSLKEPTGALYGVINMLKRLRQEYPTDYIVCVFDARGKTFRDELYPAYKEHRPSMPTELAQQIEPIHRAIAALGWPILAIEGVEADDVIATLAQKATQAHLRTIVSTGDKDLAQLVNEQVTLVNTMTNEVLTPTKVLEKFGVPPESIVDYLMLIGDTVDNVPGVSKVGPKTAVKWLQQYGTVDALVQHSAEIKGVVGDNLRQSLHQFDLTRQLLTVKYDCNIPDFTGDWSVFKPLPLDTVALLELYEHYGFRTWVRELSGDQDRLPAGDGRIKPDIPAAPSSIQYETIQTEADFNRWYEQITQADLVALDTETNSLLPLQARLVGLSFATQIGQAAYIPLRHQSLLDGEQLPVDWVLSRLKPWLENPDAPKLLHNAKYDTHVFANEGIQLAGVRDDTMLQAYVLESHKGVGMDDLVSVWLGLKGTSYEDLCGKGAKQINFSAVDIPKAAHYGAEDADFTLRLHHVLHPQVIASPKLSAVYDLEIACSRVLVAIERQGVLIDKALLDQQSLELQQTLVALEHQVYTLAGQTFNLNSPKQLGEVLFGKLMLPIKKKTASGAPSTDEDVLTQLALDYPLPKLLLEYRGLAKLKSTYTDKLPKMVEPSTGRVHTNYSQASVVTGRLASSEPNLQNIPVRTPEGRRVREAFIPRPGYVIVSADYSQIELRIMAHMSQDEHLIQAFHSGEDIHRATAAEIFSCLPLEVTAEQRRYAKVINFGLIYGMSAFGLASNLNISRDAAKHYIDRYFTRYPGVAQYMEQTRQQAREQGYVETVLGRRLWLPDIRSPNGPRRQGAERAAINAPMQGTAADLIKLAMVAVQAWLDDSKMSSRIIMQVHDELVLEVLESEIEQIKGHIPRLMTQVLDLAVPLLVELGQGANWEQAH